MDSLQQRRALPKRVLASSLLLASGLALLSSSRCWTIAAPGVELKITDRQLRDPLQSGFRVGDRVRLRGPHKLTEKGLGIFLEGKGEKNTNRPELSLDPDLKKRERERRFLDKKMLGPVSHPGAPSDMWYVEGGEEGTVVDIMPTNHYEYNKPWHWKGMARPGVIVSFDSDQVPVDMIEETDLEILDDSMSALRLKQIDDGLLDDSPFIGDDDNLYIDEEMYRGKDNDPKYGALLRRLDPNQV